MLVIISVQGAVRVEIMVRSMWGACTERDTLMHDRDATDADAQTTSQHSASARAQETGNVHISNWFK